MVVNAEVVGWFISTQQACWVVNAPRSEAGWVSARDKLHGRVVERRRVVEMALTVIVIRWSTDERGAQPRLASKRVRVLQWQRGAGRRPAALHVEAGGPDGGDCLAEHPAAVAEVLEHVVAGTRR